MLPPPGSSTLGIGDSLGQSGSQGLTEEPLYPRPQAGQSFLNVCTTHEGV